jgi:hypothetical protein
MKESEPAIKFSPLGVLGPGDMAWLKEPLSSEEIHISCRTAMRGQKKFLNGDHKRIFNWWQVNGCPDMKTLADNLGMSIPTASKIISGQLFADKHRK